MRFYDSKKFWHDKVCVNDKPSSNNAFIYTAMSRLLNKKFPQPKISDLVYYTQFHGTAKMCLIRYPHKLNPVPLSRDEIIGMNSLGYLNILALINNGWLWCNLTYKNYSTLKGLLYLIKIRNKHRNYFWENEHAGGAYAFQFAFKVMPNDQYYLLKSNGLKTSVFQKMFFYGHAIYEILFGTPGTQNLLWVQLKDLKSKFLIKFINIEKNLQKYFPSEHPFTKIEL